MSYAAGQFRFLNETCERRRKLKSYKLGRLRRFSLEDVLNYLTENNEK